MMDDWRFDHVGVVVKELARGRRNLSVLGTTSWTPVTVDLINGVALQFGRDSSGMIYELLEPLDSNSPVYGALAARKNILNHIAYRVPDLEAAAQRLREAKFAPTSPPKPAIAFGGNLIQFFVTPLNMVVELIEAFEFEHRFSSSPIPDPQDK